MSDLPPSECIPIRRSEWVYMYIYISLPLGLRILHSLLVCVGECDRNGGDDVDISHRLLPPFGKSRRWGRR